MDRPGTGGHVLESHHVFPQKCYRTTRRPGVPQVLTVDLGCSEPARGPILQGGSGRALAGRC